MNDGRILGRDREVAAFRDLLVRGALGGSTLLLVGEPGIGKSALLRLLAAMARRAGYTVLEAAGVDGEMHLPFAGLHQALTPVMRHLAALPMTQREALSTALGLTQGATPDLFQIAGAALALLTRERAERPLVLAVDDVQWLDPQSHQILAFVAHRSAATGLSFVAATRPGHRGPLLEGGFPMLPVTGLDDAAALQILDAHSADLTSSALDRIRQDAQGNPLALLELPRSWKGGPPIDGQPLAVSDRLERAFAGRVSELPTDTRDALLIAAVGSSSDTGEILAALSSFGVPHASELLLEPGVAAGLISVEDSCLSFRHPLVRSGVIQQETLARRHAAHAALADVLIADPYRRSWHRAWSIVGPDDDVAEALAATVADSLGRGAVMSAVSSLERAARLTTSSRLRGHRLMLAADKAFAAGRADVVARILGEASQVELDDLDELRVTWLAEALNDDIRSNPDLVRRLSEDAERAAALGDLGLALNLLLAAALRCWWVNAAPDNDSDLIRALDRLTQARDDPRHLAALGIADPVFRGSEIAATLESIAVDDVVGGDALRVYGLAAYAVGDFVRATDLLDRAEESFRRDGRLGMLPVVLALQLHIRLDLGDWSGAAAASSEVVTISRETGQALFAENNVLVQARGMALRGEWQAALAMMSVAESEAARLAINDRICLGYQARGAAMMSANRPAEAFTCLRRQFDPADPGYHLRESFAGVALMAEAAVACGRSAEARAIVRVLETVAVMTPSPLLQVNLLYTRAVLAPAEARDRLYQQALSYDLTRWPWIRARVQLAYGRWLARSGRPSDGATYLEDALDVFDRIGAVRWSRCARFERDELGGAGSAHRD